MYLRLDDTHLHQPLIVLQKKTSGSTHTSSSILIPHQSSFVSPHLHPISPNRRGTRRRRRGGHVVRWKAAARHRNCTNRGVLCVVFRISCSRFWKEKNFIAKTKKILDFIFKILQGFQHKILQDFCHKKLDEPIIFLDSSPNTYTEQAGIETQIHNPPPRY